MFGSVPFAGTITDRPTGMMSGGGVSWRPERGCSTRVKLPGGSFPMIVRVFDEDAVRRFGAAVHLVPSLYDLV